MKIKKGDQVIIMTGKDRGKKGKIEKIYRRVGKVLIPGINVYKKHVKPQGEGKPGGIVDLAKPISIANVALLCPKCGQKTRIGYQRAKGEKYRICKKCQGVI